MQNVYFQSIENALKDGAFVKVFLCGQRYSVVRIEKPGAEEGKVEDLISYYESSSVMDGLIGAAMKITPNDAKIPEADLQYFKDREFIGIERKLGLRGYPLLIMRVPTGRFLSMICSGGGLDYLPLVSAIEKDVQTSLELLNELLLQYDFDKADFRRYANKQKDIKYKFHKESKRK